MNEPLLSQREVEERMYYGGIKRAQQMMANAEKAGRAVTNPYGNSILREYVLPLAEAIRNDVDTPRTGRNQAHVNLLKGLDYEAVALLAVRAVINGCYNEIVDCRLIGTEIGKAVHSELVLAQIEDINPELYHTVVNSLGRRMSKDERHRMTVFKLQAAKNGIVVVEWPIGARDIVGLYLLSLLEIAGMIWLDKPGQQQAAMGAGPSPKGRYKLKRMMGLSPELLDKIESIKEHVALSAPVYGPCVEPPNDWTNNHDGGFHTDRLRYARRHLGLVISHSSAQGLYRDHDMPIVRAAVNALQRTAWQVNTRLLDAVIAVAKVRSSGEIVSNIRTDKPVPPSWLTRETKPEELEGPLRDEFVAWKHQMRDWYTKFKLDGVRYGRFSAAIRAAEMFRHYPNLYFVHVADSRGRLYPLTYGISPQGSDLSKAMLRFATGKPVDTPSAILWFHVQGANKFGFDKAPLAERKQWVIDRQDLIQSFADDPVNNRGWEEAGDPLQFLAWCFEYTDWLRDNSGTFVSHIPISMDGSCNGLQHLSAMLRDEIGGRATNLTNNEQMQDIYGLVAKAATKRAEAAVLDDPEDDAIRKKWLAHGINRKVVKRSVMTTPYGVTRLSATGYIITDYLKDLGPKGHGFQPEEYRKAANILMASAWPAIGDIVVKGRVAMDWLKKSSKIIVKSLDPENPVLTWVTPSGFLATQAYYEYKEIRVRTRLAGSFDIHVASEAETANLNRHASGMAPNFIHSLDAAHLHITTALASSDSIDALAMIHDDYGTHAADADKLFHLIRRTFFDLYSNNDPLADLAARYPGLPDLPEKGSLDLSEVLKSQYFFA